jgi:hypothetical protein
VTQRLIYATLAVLALSVPAGAQGYYEPRGFEPRVYEPRGYEPGAMPPYEVFTMLRSAGLDPVGPPARRGPNYVLRAFDRSDREVRVVVDARSGDILSVRPVALAAREPLPPRGGVGVYRDRPRGGYDAGPSIDDDDDEVLPPRRGIIDRPPQGLSPQGMAPQGLAPTGPGALPRSSNAVPPRNNNSGMRPRGDDDGDIDVDVDVDISPRSAPPRDPSVIRADPDRSGMLPPPPERFPQRAAAPAAPAKPKPAQRTEPVQRSAAAPPKQAPLPKPKPSMAPSASTQTPPAKWEDPPAPAAAPAKNPSADDTPH